MAEALRLQQDNKSITRLYLSDAECQTLAELLYIVQRGVTGRGKHVSDIEGALMAVGFDVDTFMVYSRSLDRNITIAEGIERGLIFTQATVDTEVYYNPDAD